MRIDAPSLAVDLGFVNDPLGTHTSRTMMLTELRALLESAGPDATYADYQDATIRENACGKATLSTRSKTFRHLRELYALEPGVPLFYALRLLWQSDPTAQPLLAALCAAARDPMLRTTIELILALAPGEATTSSELAEALQDAFPGNYSPGVAARAGRNLASSWQQAGLLAGRAYKTRTHPCARPAVVAYALFLGHVCGARGDLLFTTPWMRLIDLPEWEARAQAVVASRQGWIEYRESGGATEVTFRHLLSAKQEQPA